MRQCTYREMWDSDDGPASLPMRCQLREWHGPSRRTLYPGEKGPNSKTGEHYLTVELDHPTYIANLPRHRPEVQQ